MDLSCLGSEPVGGEHPAGSDVRYDPVFERLQAQIDKTALPSAMGTVDWEQVVTLAADILEHRSKDLLVAGYLAVGLVHTRSLAGLVLSLKIYRDLLEQHGPGLFPRRPRGRVAAVEWWLEKTEQALKPLKELPLAAEERCVLEAHLAKLGPLLSDLMPDAPSLQVLQEFLRQTGDVGEMVRPETLPAEPVPRGLSLKVVSVEGAAPQAAPTDPQAVLEDGLRRLREAAVLLRGEDHRNPLAYRLCRQAAWLGLCAPPPAQERRTLLAAPSASLKGQLAELKRSGNLPALLNAIEAQVGQFIFWLDLHRLAADALTELGNASAAVAAVCGETVQLLGRLPGLEELSFSDGTPFADAATKAWLSSQVNEGRPVVAAPPLERSVAKEANQEVEPEMVTVGALMKEGKLVEAVDQLQGGLDRATSARSGLQLRLSLIRILLEAQQVEFALPHLEKVLTDIETHRLEQYDPPLALEGMTLAFCAFEAQPEPELKHQAKQILHRIGRMDAALMIRLAQSKR